MDGVGGSRSTSATLTNSSGAGGHELRFGSSADFVRRLGALSVDVETSGYSAPVAFVSSCSARLWHRWIDILPLGCCGQDNISRMIVVRQHRAQLDSGGLPAVSTAEIQTSYMEAWTASVPPHARPLKAQVLALEEGSGHWADAGAARSDSRHQHGGTRTMLAVDTMIECASLEVVTGDAASVATAAATADKSWWIVRMRGTCQCGRRSCLERK